MNGARREEEALAEYQRRHADMFDDMVRIVLFYYERSRDRDDYFWESKRMLAEVAPRWKPQRSFLVLTSGLVKNLVLDERRASLEQRRFAAAESGAAELVETHDPDQLSFVCIHLRYRAAEPAEMWVLIEPADPADPTLFRSRNWHINCLAPRFDNDPIQFPELAPHVRRLGDRVIALDTTTGEPLAEFWRRTRSEIMAVVTALPEAFELVRVFGE